MTWDITLPVSVSEGLKLSTSYWLPVASAWSTVSVGQVKRQGKSRTLCSSGIVLRRETKRYVNGYTPRVGRFIYMFISMGKSDCKWMKILGVPRHDETETPICSRWNLWKIHGKIRFEMDLEVASSCRKPPQRPQFFPQTGRVLPAFGDLLG